MFELQFGVGSFSNYYQRYFSEDSLDSMFTQSKLYNISKNIGIAHLRFLEYYNYYKRDGKLHEILSVSIKQIR